MNEMGITETLISNIGRLIEDSRRRTVMAVNTTMVYTYYEIGRMIVEHEQNGKLRAGYGMRVLKNVYNQLIFQYGKGWSVENLKAMRRFYLVYSNWVNTVYPIQDNREEIQIIHNKPYPKFTLSWSHYLKLMRIDNVDERRFYEIEATRNHWSLRELERQFNTSLYERLAMGRDKEKIYELSQQGQIIERPQDMIKDPYILEFTGLSEMPSYTEKNLEAKLIDNLQMFLLELGKGFTFVGRQVRISFDEEHYYIDLVFYNRILRAFVLVDLKREKLKHQDIGQMQMYVNYYDREVKLEDENPTIGLLLCTDKTDAMVKYTLPKDNKQIFAAKYKTILPGKSELKQLMNSTSE